MEEKRVTTPKELREWVEQARVGEDVQYHGGWSTDGEQMKLTAFYHAEKGELFLWQRRNAVIRNMWDYMGRRLSVGAGVILAPKTPDNVS